MTETAFERVITALERADSKVKMNDGQKAQAQCPHHEDSNPSLTVTAIVGRVLLRCHAGCVIGDVVGKLGLTLADLFDNPRPVKISGISAHAMYRYDNGRSVIRSAAKEFRQAGTDAPPELYRLGKVKAAVAAGEGVYVVEGEQDVHALESVGATATSSPMGAGKWDKIDPSPLTGATVTVVADKDDAGRKHAADIVASITGLAASVVVVEAAEGKDAADHIAAGRGLDEFVPVVTPTVDGAQLLDDVAAAFDRYVVTPSAHARDGIVLWTAATHGQMAWQNATRLVVNSPEKRCGKSRLLEIVAALSHRPVLTANVSTAALFRMIGEDDPPTILLDEADAVFGTKTKADQNEDLRALLNAGYSRDLPTWRCVGAQQIPTPFTTYAMAALAGIGQMPDTITDRAVNVTMRRRAAGEKIHPYRARRDRPALHVLRDRTSKWVTSNLDALKVADPVMPLEDRAADNWASLIALADLAGGDWPKRARAAALALTAEHDLADAASSLNMELIHNIADIWEASGERKFISSGDLATQLRSDKDAPWAELELTPRKLSARLKWFGIKPKHNTAKTERGYHRDHFDDAIARYPSPGSNDDNNPGTAPSVSVQASEISSDLQEHDGRLSELDTSIRPAGISVRDVFADQSTIRTLGRIGTGIPGDAPVMPGLDGSGALPESEAEMFERCQLCDDRLFARPSQLSGVCGPCQAVRFDDRAVAEPDRDTGPLFGA